jgi:hypothetical protein
MAEMGRKIKYIKLILPIIIATFASVSIVIIFQIHPILAFLFGCVFGYTGTFIGIYWSGVFDR